MAPTDDLMTGLEHQQKTKLGRDHTFAFARPQIHDHLIEQFRDRIQPCDVSPRILFVIDLVNVN